ncbi:MAG: hypothetical protein ACO3L6_02300 [Dehalococcoidia bacterium]|jgi:biopolymer transport protein ExbB/TolQ
MAVTLGTLLAILCVAVIAYPLFRKNRYRMVSESFVTREKLRAERLRIYRKINDLESDYTSGDLTEDDYQQQRDQLRHTAAQLLMQETGAGSARERDIEEEIAQLRNRSSESLEGGDTVQ